MLEFETGDLVQIRVGFNDAGTKLEIIRYSGKYIDGRHTYIAKNPTTGYVHVTRWFEEALKKVSIASYRKD